MPRKCKECLSGYCRWHSPKESAPKLEDLLNDYIKAKDALKVLLDAKEQALALEIMARNKVKDLRDRIIQALGDE